MKRFLTFAVILCIFLSVSEASQIKLTFTGDVTLGNTEDFLPNPDSFTNAARLNGYNYFLANFADYFSQDDLTIINLEGTLTDSNRSENLNKVMRFRGATDFVQILTSSSVECANISNNHIHDFGSQGFNSTLNTLESAGIKYFGEHYGYVFEKDGIRIGFLGAETGFFSENAKWLTAEISRMKTEDAVSAVIFVLHCGAEYHGQRTATQEKFAHKVIDAGADLVIMHHPHVPLGVEIYNNRTICYSLGNFCFGGNGKVWAHETILVRAALDFDDSGNYTGQQIEIIPAVTSGTTDKNNYQPDFANGEQVRWTMALVQADTNFALPDYDSLSHSVKLEYLPCS